MSVTLSGQTRPWLFEAFPGLKGRVPWTRLVDAPTPVTRPLIITAGTSRENWSSSWQKPSPGAERHLSPAGASAPTMVWQQLFSGRSWAFRSHWDCLISP